MTRRILILIITSILLLCGCQQNEYVNVFQESESINSLLAIRNDGVCFELPDDACSIVKNLQGKKTNRNMSDVCARFRFVISTTAPIGETSFTKTITDDHWTEIYLSRDNLLQFEGSVYEIVPDTCKQLLELFENSFGEENKPSFPDTIDYLVVNPCLSTAFSVKENRIDFQQIVQEMRFDEYSSTASERVNNEFNIYCGGFIAINENAFVFNGKPYKTSESGITQLRKFYDGINGLIVNAEKPYKNATVESASTNDKNGNILEMDQQQCMALSLLLQDVAVYETVKDPSVWEWGTVYIGSLSLADGSYLELYAGPEVVVINNTMLHVSADSANNLIRFIRTIRGL